jgi:Dynein light intermediate chain (DLIC)
MLLFNRLITIEYLPDVADNTCLGIWLLDSSFNKLICHAITESNYEHTGAVLLVVSLASPWNVIEKLEEMAKMVMDCCSQLKVSERVRQKCIERGICRMS